MARNINVGKVAQNFIEEPWSSANTYSILDCVKNEHQSSFVALKDVPAGIDLYNSEYWFRQTDFDGVAAAEAARVLEFETKIMQVDSDVEAAEEFKNQAEQAVIDVGEIGDSKVTAINTAGSTQVTNVNNAGTTKVTAINTAGTNKLNEINAAGAVLYSAQALDDIQKATSRSNIGAAAAADLTAHIDSLSSHANLFATKNDLITAPASGDSLINVTDAYAAWLKSLTVFGKSVQDGTPSPDVPVPINGVSGSLKKCGKNLIPYPYIEMSKTKNGLTFTVNTNGTITITGTATADTTFSLRSPSEVWFVPRGIYTLSGTPAGGGSTTYFMQLQVYNGATLVSGVQDDGLGKTINLSAATYDRGAIYIAVKSGVVVSNIVFNPQLELGSVATPYEPYTGATYPSPDLQGIPLGATIPAAISSNLALMSGVYHDGAQYWCGDTCEYAVLADGAYKNRVLLRAEKYTFTGTEIVIQNTVDVATGMTRFYFIAPNVPAVQNVVCNHFPSKDLNFKDTVVPNAIFHRALSSKQLTFIMPTSYLIENTVAGIKAWFAAKYAANNPVTVWYLTTAPVETLSDPIFPDAPKGTANIYHTSEVQPHITAEYPLDIKAYVDNKINELTAAIAELSAT